MGEIDFDIRFDVGDFWPTLTFEKMDSDEKVNVEHKKGEVLVLITWRTSERNLEENIEAL